MMQNEEHDIIVIGGGLSGFSALDNLLSKNKKYNIRLIEASERIGGRLRTIDGLDFGASWVWPNKDKLMVKLMKDLKIKLRTPSDRERILKSKKAATQSQVGVRGGTEQIVTKLAKKWAKRIKLTLNTSAHMIKYQNEKVYVYVQKKGGLKLNGNESYENLSFYTAKHVIVAVPPQMILKHINFFPPLPPDTAKAMEDTPTWMATASKVYYEFAEPFWRKEHGSNFFESSSDWALFDASLDIDKRYQICAFKTGLSPYTFTSMTSLNELDKEVNAKLGPMTQHYFMNKMTYHWYNDMWVCALDSIDNITKEKAQEQLNEYNYKYGIQAMCRIGQYPELREPLAGKVYFASTETEDQRGHMEGALRAGSRVSEQIHESFRRYR